MFITLSRNPQGPGFIVKAGTGKTAQVICNAAYEFFHEARQFATAEANRRGWHLRNQVTDDVPSVVVEQALSASGDKGRRGSRGTGEG